MAKTVIVTGGRDYSDHNMLEEVLDALDPDLVVQGGASGADTLAKQWAEENQRGCVTFGALWGLHGKAAGPKRNTEMLDANPDAIVVAFPGGKGTENCVKQALDKNMIVLRVL